MSTQKDSLMWDNKMRITTLETKMTNVERTVEKINENVASIMMEQLPLLKTAIEQNKWKVGLVIGVISAIGSIIASTLFAGIGK